MSIRNLDALFHPDAIALIGASERPGSVGAVLAANLFGSGFKGPVMPVNPHAGSIRSAVSYRSVAALPLVPDLAVIATPAPTVPGIVAELGARGCRAAVVISAGFGQDDLRQRLLDAARPNLMRIVGPNCIGFISPPAGINASFAHLTPRSGDLAFISQSGAIATAVLDWADVREIGFSHVVSVGDMSDVDIGDLLDYLALDAKTRAILLYVESITDAQKFMSAARIAARAKPVVVIKAGRSEAGAKAAASHTGALAGSDAVYDAAFRRAGMLRVDTLRELFEAVGTLASGLRPSGDRLAILTNGGGAGVLATDTLSDYRGELAQLSPDTLAKLDTILPGSWSHGNPVDILGDAPGALYAQALEAILADPGQDAVLVMNCPTAVADGLDAAQAVVGTLKSNRRAPILTCWLGERAARESRRLFAASGLPTYDTPDASVRAFMQLVDYRRNQELMMQTPPAALIGDFDKAAASALIDAVMAGGRSTLTEPEAKRLLALYNVPVVRTLTAATPAEAARLAETIGYPVALKILSPDISHKSDVGGVRLELESAASVEEAATQMLKLVAERRPDARVEGFTVQEMILRPRAHELIAGIGEDRIFGPIILFGQGGTAVEVIADRAIGLPPLNLLLARDMIGRTRIAKLLHGYRDRPAADLDAVATTLVKLSQMLADHPEIAELDINPLLADENGVIALDARVVVRPAPAGQRSRFAIQPYPDELAGTIRLRNGDAIWLRPIRPEDEASLIEMLEQSEPEDLRLRFFAAMKRIGHAFAARLTQIDYSREMAFVARAADGPQHPILGVARLIVDPDGELAEFGIMVRSDQKGRGLGYCLMQRILTYARERGIRRVYGEVLAENTTMLAMSEELGFVRSSVPGDPGLRRVEIAL
ncbi:bifunctional acetate--CoA ligase family protein/GNAT family N-acetyltransferase [Mangrovicella endophytica]|uniref:bifunctional acetate--CoA ligase family protein/GNAT family N-acetyltransferase n=1 Tax=Mangrovicella endophytica TaxID=2066697 RepID=UPI000C9E3A4A|nr:bifunctional acetate--CoA ligase family protein/GNAT family N-acetyltransferase [Mangrovicella endophytica]